MTADAVAAFNGQMSITSAVAIVGVIAVVWVWCYLKFRDHFK